MPVPLAVVVLLIVFSQLAYATDIVSGTSRLSEGQFTFHYDADEPDVCQNLLLLGVGTGMRTNAYDMLGADIASASPVMVLVVDHNPWRLIKTSSTKFANLANALVKQIDRLIPEACAGAAWEKTIMVGGHSASGQAAWNSLNQLLFVPDALVGLDPFRLESTDSIDIPTLMFGFTETSCMVNADNAAKAGYEASSNDRRVFVNMDNSNGSVGHCSFTDAGCYGFVCSQGSNSEWVRSSVGKTVGAFVSDLESGVFARADYGLQGFTNTTLYLNEEEVPVDRITRLLRGSSAVPAFA